MSANAEPVVRLVHLSDIHITARPLGWGWRDSFSKRLTGWMNYQVLGRKRRFRHAEDVLDRLMADLRADPPDRILFSGDATALAFEAEFRRAAELLGVLGPEPLPGLAVPGNHDYYVRRVARLGLFERYFAAWLTGERVDEATYPFAQRAGHVWLVAVNSATANRAPYDAAGAVDPAQLQRLKTLLSRLSSGPRLLITHYPLCVSAGQRERRTHGLRNLADLVRVAADGGVSLWLHGHRHGPYFLAQPPAAPFPVVCAGSATQTGHWSYSEYQIHGKRFRASRRLYSPATASFQEAQTFELCLHQ